MDLHYNWLPNLLINQVGSAIFYGGSIVGAVASIVIAIVVIIVAVTFGKGSAKSKNMRDLGSMVE